MIIRFKSCTIKISFFFALAITVMSVADKTNSAFFCLLAAALHESGHIFALICYKENPKEIIFTPFGIRIERNSFNKLSFLKEAVVAFAGPFVNILLALIFHNTYFSKINVAIALLNLLPCDPLDGSKIVENLLKIKMAEEKAEKISLIISCITVFPVAVAGFILLLKSRYNFSLLFVSVYLIFFIAVKKKNIPSTH
ncbi:MAG: hypothetical protein E7536_05535 [Ruminococcaceae bacterium]|nr:hypothetical protein [Oscillospiraceae bacterium]